MKATLSTSILLSLLVASSMSFAAPATAKKVRNPSQNISAEKKAPVATTAPYAAVKVAPAVANKSISTYVFQPYAGETALNVTPSYNMNSASVKARGDARATANDSTLTSITAEVRKGFTDTTSLSAKIGLGSQKADKVPEASGFTDLTLNLQKLQPLASGQLVYGADLTYSPGEKEESYKYDTGTNKGSSSGNLYSGGSALKPYVGYQVDNGTAVAGVNAKYSNFFDRSVNTRDLTGTKRTYSVSGGNILSIEAYREMMLKNYWVGGKLGFSQLNGLEYSARSTRYDVGSTDSLTAGVYGTVNLQKRVSLIPSITYSKSLRGTGGAVSVEDLESTDFALLARMPL